MQDALFSSSIPQNYKGKLLEGAQAQKWTTPIYTKPVSSGLPHALTFTTECTITIRSDTYEATGTGRSKVGAEQDAARQLLALVPQEAVEEKDAHKNPVSILHEMEQATLIFNVNHTFEDGGAAHSKTHTCFYTVTTRDNAEIKVSATGLTKQAAEQKAAAQILVELARHEEKE